MSADPSASPLDRHASPVRARGQIPGLAVASFVLGVLAILTAILVVPGILLGIVGLVLGLTGRGNAKRAGQPIHWMATAGSILSGLAILGAVVLVAIAAAS
ncbi:MAG TPA: hypothetical protein VI318_20725 [Baekduia sp.]